MADEIKHDEKGASDTPVISAREIPIRYYGTEDIVAVFADQAMVSHIGGMFNLMFFQMQIQPSLSLAELQNLNEIPAQCVAKIALTPALMQQFFNAINENLGKVKFNNELQQKSLEE